MNEIQLKPSSNYLPGPSHYINHFEYTVNTTPANLTGISTGQPGTAIGAPGGGGIYNDNTGAIYFRSPAKYGNTAVRSENTTSCISFPQTTECNLNGDYTMEMYLNKGSNYSIV